ncbi:TPA: hypothetical protein ACF31P_004647, partial [Vibrio parahaemolyticus]
DIVKTNTVTIRKFQKRYNTYLKLLLELRGDMGWFFDDSHKASLLTVPFILTLAAALECSLNDHLTEHFDDEFGDSSKQMLPGLMSMNFKGKLINIVPILTKYKFKLNTEHKVYALLVELIKLRNNLVHNKSDYDSHEFTVSKDENGNVQGFQYDDLESLMGEDVDYTFGVKADIGAIHDAVEKFHELFLEHYEDKDFSGNDLIIPLEENDGIKIVLTD